ncbi:MAG: twin-arginine translocation signal domain-containing protein [Proteobacteria bacterium]|nr:twin-arginine translocation signal domain-containing protein [Pseudomonadota bacterium]
MKTDVPKKRKQKINTNCSRRDFLKKSGIAGASGLLAAYGMSKNALAMAPRPPEVIPSPTLHKQAIIIGSGFGGAITALRLCEKGVETMIIEKGKRWQTQKDKRIFSPYIYPDGRSTWLNNTTVVPLGPPLPINKYTGVLEGHFYRGMRVLTGACYGGGSVVYGGLHVKPPENLFTQVFPPEINYKELETYYQRVGDMLGISTVPDDIYQTKYFKHYRVMEEQDDVAGLKTARILSASDWDIVRQELDGTIKPSSIHGEAVYGVNSGAKKSLDTNYLAQAEQSGFLDVKTLHDVKDISIGADGKYLIQLKEIDTKGKVIEEKVYSCDYLFLAAGSIGTTNLLVKARAKGLLPDLNYHIGKGWGNNGNVEALRTNLDTFTGQWQGGPPAAAVEDYDNPITPIFIEHPQLPLGINCNCLLYFGIGINPTRGQFFYNPFKDKAYLYWPQKNNQQQMLNDALLHTMHKLNDANGGIISGLVGGLKGYNDAAAYHPLGGAVMGQACDFFGRVKNYDKLYVNDSALIPGSTASANPAFTVAAIAERNIERIIAEDF